MLNTNWTNWLTNNADLDNGVWSYTDYEGNYTIEVGASGGYDVYEECYGDAELILADASDDDCYDYFA